MASLMKELDHANWIQSSSHKTLRNTDHFMINCLQNNLTF